MMPIWLPYALTTLVGLAASWVALRNSTVAHKQAAEQAKQAAALDKRKVDREELDSARAFWKESLDAANSQIAQLRTDLDAERRETSRLRVRVGKLEQILRRAGIQVPNGMDGP